MIERYAFISNENYEIYAMDRWPDAINVGENYKMVQFIDTIEPDLIDYIESLGFTAKYPTAPEAIIAIDKGLSGPFVSDRAIAGDIVNYFNPDEGYLE